jgi:diguanylate cyclase
MRYSEPKERCAELLRVALGHMGRHDASLNPTTFTLWYEYAAGLNPRLHAALDQLLRDNVKVDDEVVAQLYEAHVARTEEVTVQRLSGEFHRVLGTIAQSASSTGDRAHLFGAQLEGLSAALESQDIPSLTPHLSEALAGTAEMKSAAVALQHQVAASQHEISRLRSDLDRARGEALLDPLTSILNRKGFDQKIQTLFDAPAKPGHQHCLVMLDIDHFKKVNDAHGHVMGDRVIQGLGEILRRTVIGGTHASARYGGEEFAIVLPHSSLDQAAQIAETVRMRAKAMKIRNRNTQDVLFTITVSGGVAALREGDDATALIARADSALYQSKHSGRDRVSCG